MEIYPSQVGGGLTRCLLNPSKKGSGDVVEIYARIVFIISQQPDVLAMLHHHRSFTRFLVRNNPQLATMLERTYPPLILGILSTTHDAVLACTV